VLVTKISKKETKGKQMRLFQFLVLIFLLFLLNFGMALGNPGSSDSDSQDYSKPVNEDYQNAYYAVKSGNFQEAIKYLKQAAKSSTNKADIYNLLGYSHRKLDLLEDAFFYYHKALKLDPRHQGANEYIGELYLRTNNLKKAEEHLEVLDDVCLFGCDEYDDLKDAIEKYKKSI